jgi:hypothetical protein
MDGWLSNIPFITTILFFSCIIVGFIHSWWGGLLMSFVSTILGSLTEITCTRSLSSYLPFLLHKMVNRAADYRAKNDAERSEASESVCKDLAQLTSLYQDSQLKPPNPKQLKDIPYGDMSYWLNLGVNSP